MFRNKHRYQEAVLEGDEGGSTAETTEASTEEAPQTNEAQQGEADAGAESPKPFYTDLPEDWRKQSILATGMTEDDKGFEKRMKQLERVSDYGVLAKNYFEAQDKIRKGEISNGLPEDATPEQLTAYREAHGIPESPDAYKLALDEGLVLGESDERIMGSVYEIAHGKNIDAETMSEMTNAVLKSRQAEAQARIDQDGVDKLTSDKILRDTWNHDTETNKNLVIGLVNQLPETIREPFMSARLPDGRAAFNSPELIVAMADWAAKINPSATVVPNSNNPMQTINDEIAALEGKMGTDEWYKDTEAQSRYQKLITAKENMG